MLNPLGIYAKGTYNTAQYKDLFFSLDVKSYDEFGAIVKEMRNYIIEVDLANNDFASTMEELSSTFNSQSTQVFRYGK